MHCGQGKDRLNSLSKSYLPKQTYGHPEEHKIQRLIYKVIIYLLAGMIIMEIPGAIWNPGKRLPGPKGAGAEGE